MLENFAITARPLLWAEEILEIKDVAAVGSILIGAFVMS